MVALVWPLFAVLAASCMRAESITIVANVTKGPQTSEAADLSAAVQDDLKAEQEDLQGMLHWALSKTPNPKRNNPSLGFQTTVFDSDIPVWPSRLTSLLVHMVRALD
jgi:hypothetical protein